MQTSIAKWGNSLALRLPRHVVEGANLREGATVQIEIQGDTLVVTPTRKRFRLSELLADMKPKHQHKETDWGPKRGEEEW